MVIKSGLQRSQKSSNPQKNGYLSHILGIRAISPIHWTKFLIGTYIIECPKDRITINKASGVRYWVISGRQRSQKSWKSQKNGYFTHILGIWAISPIHWIKCHIGTYMIECPIDKMIIRWASGVVYGVIFGLQMSQKSSKIILKKSPKSCYFSHILGIRVISPIHWIKLVIGTYIV